MFRALLGLHKQHSLCGNVRSC